MLCTQKEQLESHKQYLTKITKPHPQNSYKQKHICHSNKTIAILVCYNSNDRIRLDEHSLQRTSKTDEYWLQTIKSKLCMENIRVLTSDSCSDIFPVELFCFDNFFFMANFLYYPNMGPNIGKNIPKDFTKGLNVANTPQKRILIHRTGI